MDNDTILMLSSPLITTSVSSGDTVQDRKNLDASIKKDHIPPRSVGKSSVTEKTDSKVSDMPSSVPSEVTKVGPDGLPPPSEKNTAPLPPCDSGRQENDPLKNLPSEGLTLVSNVDNSGKESHTAATDEESTSSSSFLSDNGLRWTEKKTSRVGHEYQAAFLPEAGSYLNLQGDDFDQLEQLLLADQIWDPLKATCRGINDYVHLNCPSNKKEAALELLHQRDYDDSHFSDELKRLPVLDGSDWTLIEHENFRKLMQSSRHNVHHVAKAMGKSINNCLTVYYKIINVRETRSTKKRFSGMKPMEEINELKDIGRSMRIEKRNQRKRSSSISAEDCSSKSSPSQSGSKRKRRKASSASDKVRNHNPVSKPSSSSGASTRSTKKTAASTNDSQKDPEPFAKRTSPRIHKSLPCRLADEQAFETLYASLRTTKNNETNPQTKGKVNGVMKKKAIHTDKQVNVSRRTLRNHKSTGIEKPKVTQDPSAITANSSNTRGTRAAKVQALKSLLRKTEFTRNHSLNEQYNANTDEEAISLNVAKSRKRTKQSTSKLLQNKGKKSIPEDEENYEEDSVSGTRLAKRQALKSLRSHAANDDSKWCEKKGTPRKNISILKSDEPNSDVDLWERRYEELIQFKEENGHCLVPKVYPQNRQLSYWVFRQRGLYSGKKKQSGNNHLSKERIQKLKDIGFVFRAKRSKEQNEVDAARRKPQLDAKWNTFFEEFLKYKEKTGSCLIPKVYEENQPLSSWAFTQRHQMKRRKDGKHNLLNDERIKKLNDIGFVWHAKQNKEWQDADRIRKQALVESMWQNHYKSLLEFKKKHGHTRVPKVYKSNQPLSTWVFRQRAHYRRRTQGEDPHSLSDERLKLLEKAGFQFRVRK